VGVRVGVGVGVGVRVGARLLALLLESVTVVEQVDDLARLLTHVDPLVRVRASGVRAIGLGFG
jgi:hypothetical protein